MFKTNTPVIEPAPDEMDPIDAVIPLSHLALDLPAPATGWEPFLTVRNIAILVDDVGRLAISRDDARTLIAEQHEHERRAQEVARRQEQAAIAADQAFRAALPRGLPWHALPDGVSPAQAWAQAEKDAQPRRQSVLQHALSNSGELEYHPFRNTPDEE